MPRNGREATGAGGFSGGDRGVRERPLLDQARRWGLISTAGLVLPITIVLGYLGGSYLDRRFGTDPVFLLVGVLVGAVGGFLEMFNLLRRAGVVGGGDGRRRSSRHGSAADGGRET